MYSVGSIPRKGEAMFADVDINAGVRILEDRLILWIPDSTINENLSEQISNLLERLPPDQQRLFEALQCPDHSDRSRLVSKFLANRFDLPEGGSGVFWFASRINHSCSPNAYASWNRNLLRLTVHAIVDILADEEITISYVLPYYSVENRLALLRDHYGFDCICPICNLATPEGLRGEQVRRSMEALHRAADRCNENPSDNGEQEQRFIEEFIQLTEEQRMTGQFLSRMYRRAKQYNENWGPVRVMVEYAVKEHETNTRLLGEEHDMTVDSAGSMSVVDAFVRMYGMNT